MAGVGANPAGDTNALAVENKNGVSSGDAAGAAIAAEVAEMVAKEDDLVKSD